MVSVMKNSYECVVIGGGVAGSTAAYHLTKLGYKVALLEKTLVPHHKVCGEFLSFETIDYLQEMGISLDDASPVIKHFQLFSSGSKTTFTFPLAGRGRSRYALDEELLNNAGNAGADVFRGICMRSYHQEDENSVRIETTTEDFYARHLFVATGKHDHSKEHKREGKDNSYVGLKTHLKIRGKEFKETTVLFTFPGGYGGICPVENGAMNFCFLIDKKIYKALNGNLDAVLAYLRRHNHQMDIVLQEADFIAPFCAISHIPYGFLRAQSNEGSIYFLGDQRMVIPSFTGDGMAIALSTAKNCAYEFDCRQKGMSVHAGQIQENLKKQMHWALTAQTMLKFSWLIDLGMSIPGFSLSLIRIIFNKTRISKMKDLVKSF